MGFCLSWLAIKNFPIDDVFKVLGVEKTDDTANVPGWGLCYLDLKNGWHLIILNGDDLMMAKVNWLRKLSCYTDVISVFVEEHVMYSSACCFRDGKRAWLIEHDSSRSLDDIKTIGRLPECFKQVHAAQLNKRESDQRPVDYIFDVPVEVGRLLTGYAHNRSVPDCENGVYWKLVGEDGDVDEQLRKLLSQILIPKGFRYFKSSSQFRRSNTKCRDEITIQVLSGNRINFYFGVLHIEVAETIARLKGGPKLNEYNGTMRHYSPNVGPRPFAPIAFRLETNAWRIKPGAENSEVTSRIIEFINDLVLPWIDKYHDLAAVREDLAKDSRSSITKAYEQILTIDLLWNDKAHLLKYLAIVNQSWPKMAISWRKDFETFYNSARAIEPDVFPELVTDSNQLYYS